MFHNLAVRHNAVIRIEKAAALKLFLIQLLFVFAVIAVWCMIGMSSKGLSVLLGGVSGCLPHLVFTRLILSFSDTECGKLLALAFCLGEFAKLLLSGAALAFLIVMSPGNMLAIISGFMAAQVGLWVAPLASNRKRARQR